MGSFIVYCDESSHTNVVRRKYYAIGSLWLPRDKKQIINNDLKLLRKKNNIGGEVKWQKTSRSCLGQYGDLIDYFFSVDDLRFRVIVVDQEKIDYRRYHQNDQELGFYKFYYQLLVNWLEPNNEYLILLDRKSNREATRFVDLRNVLANASPSTTKLIDLTIVDSKESNLLQLCDLLTGAVAADYNNDLRAGSAKERLRDLIAGHLNRPDLRYKTASTESKFNIFKIDLS